MNTATLTSLQPIRGTAQLDPDGALTVGVYADGSPAGWPLTDPDGSARHALIVASASAGGTSLLRSILDAAQAAGAGTQAIDVTSSGLGLGVHSTACDLTTARTMLVKHLHVAYQRLATVGHVGPWPLRVLAIDGLQRLTGDAGCAQALSDLLRHAAKAGIAVLALTQDPTILACGDTSRSLLAAHTLVQLRINRRTDAILLNPNDPGPIDGHFPDGSSTAGIGYLPLQRPDMPFRAWLP